MRQRTGLSHGCVEAALSGTVDVEALRVLFSQGAAAAGCVLLKNSGGVLPLTPGLNLAVVGPNGGCGSSGSGNGTLPPCDAQARWGGDGEPVPGL